MKKAHNPESRLCSPCSGVSYGGMWTNFPISPEDRTAAHFKCAHAAFYDFITRGHFPHVGWEEESLPPVPGMLTELSLRAAWEQCVDKYLALEQGLALNIWAAEAQQSSVAKTTES